MKSRLRTLSSALSLFFATSAAVLLAAVARADLPRPPGWEPSCTIAKEQAAGGSCEECRGYKDPDPCQEELAKKGYTRRCQEGGAGSYVAVWCKGSAPSNSPDSNTNSTGSAPARSAPPTSTTSTTPPRGSGGCGVGTGASELQGEGLSALLAVGLALAISRRRRT